MLEKGKKRCYAKVENRGGVKRWGKKALMISILAIITLVLITVGVTYAFFNYTKEGTTENSITTGTITFIYEEVETQGAVISIEDAFPISDSVGKAQSGSGKVFNFKVKLQTMNTAAIPYTVTAIDGSKWYILEESDENSETVVLLSAYNLNDDGSYNTECGVNVNGSSV